MSVVESTVGVTLGGIARHQSWSREAVIYQVYVRSFADSNGDGIGDLAGVTSRLDYLVSLGVDAIWLTPFYPSPMADGGYDVADYRNVDPMFGTLDDFDQLLAQAHQHGLKIIIDLVPNHTSTKHRWFVEALAAEPDSPRRGRFHFHSGGDQPPNNWQSIFSGSAWTQLPDGDWYLHLFAPEQPDLNWDHPDVRAEFTDVLRFWLDRGVDGIRVDVAHGMVKAAGLPDAGSSGTAMLDGAHAPYFDQDGVHEIYREWRAILDTYVPERIAVAEAWLPNLHRTARYVRPDELHQAFNFDLLSTPWSAPDYRRAIDAALEVMATVGAPTTWVMSNHDVVRHVTRLAGGGGGGAGGAGQLHRDTVVDHALGLRRARAATLLILALPGSVYLYQGEELGLPEVFDLPPDTRQDPIFFRTSGLELGRDGCRVPIPWTGHLPPFGFSACNGQPWLPQPAAWSAMTVAAQDDDPTSTLNLYRSALQLRRTFSALGDGELRWLPAANDHALNFERPGRDGLPTVRCVVNLSADPVPGGASGELLVASGPLGEDGTLPPDSAAWWTVS